MENLSIDDLVEKHWLSVRSTNVLRCNNLNNLVDILEFFIKKRGFDKLHNCGEKSNRELAEICNEYLQEYHQNNSGEEVSNKDTLEIYNELNPYKKSIFNRFFYSLLNKLSIRAINGLTSLCGDYKSVQKILYLFYVAKTDFKKIKNIGDKSRDELNLLKVQTQSFINSIKNLPSEHLNKAYLKLIIQSTIDSLGISLSIDTNSLFTDNEKVRHFRLIYELLVNGQLFNKNQTRIFQAVYCINDDLNLQKVADELVLTRERVRQINIIIEESFKSAFSFIRNFDFDDCANYGVIKQTDLLIIDNDFADSINQIEKLNFNPLFYANIICLFLGEDYSIVDPTLSETKRPSMHSRSNLQAFYILKKELTNAFDFDGLLVDLNLKRAERITDPYGLYFEGYIQEFFLVVDVLDKIDAITKVCEEMLFQEMSIVIDNMGYINFERNVKRQIYDYLIEILDEIGEMVHVDRILAEMEKKFPEVEFNESSVRSTMNREKDTFIFIGRSSTYGLKKWENEVNSLRGGTIRELAEEYLELQDTPKHVSEILEYVNQFRNTNAKSLITNIEITENGKFIIYPGDFVGLSSKIYLDTSIYKRMNGVFFTSSYLKKMNNWPLEYIVEHYSSKYNYIDIQVRATLMKRVILGDFILTKDKKIIV